MNIRHNDKDEPTHIKGPSESILDQICNSDQHLLDIQDSQQDS